MEEDKKMTTTEWKKSLCAHGPGGKCLNCASVTTEEFRQQAFEEKCDHPPHGKCPKCLNKGFIKDAKHESFDHFLNELKLKCKDMHPPDAKCHNCLPPTQISYKLKPSCKEHAPFPAGLCTKCMPPTANLLRQFYRHVDYVEFMNRQEIESFMLNWGKQFELQRMAYLYGYYSKDPNFPVKISVH
jgi:nuclear protein localization family protein 4